MTREEAVQAIMTGIRLVKEKKEEGFQVIATGEMGIGNTTTSSAVSTLLLGEMPERMTGRGAGLTSEGLEHKVSVIKRAIERNRPVAADTLDVLAKVGGFDIAGLTGVFLGGAYYRRLRLLLQHTSFVLLPKNICLPPMCQGSRE